MMRDNSDERLTVSDELLGDRLKTISSTEVDVTEQPTEKLKELIGRVCEITGMSLVEIRDSRKYAAVNARRIIACFMHEKQAADYKTIACLLGMNESYVPEFIAHCEYALHRHYDYRMLYNKVYEVS